MWQRFAHVWTTALALVFQLPGVVKIMHNTATQRRTCTLKSHSDVLDILSTYNRRVDIHDF